jgi:AcrR family transcriptional regulator
MNKNSQTPTKVYKAATDLFALKGFEGTSIRDIAAAVGLTISAIYHHFGSKEGLLLAILEEVGGQVRGRLREVLEMDLEPQESFRLLIRTHLQMLRTFGKEIKILYHDLECLSPGGQKTIKQIQRDILCVYKEGLENLRAAGCIRDGQNLTVLAFNILGVVNWHLNWYRPAGSLSPAKIGEEMLSFIQHGMVNGPIQEVRKVDSKSRLPGR